MKIKITGLSILLLLFLTNCKKNKLSPEELHTQTLVSKSWVINQVTLDGSDITSQFAGMTLAFTSTTYQTNNGGLVWPSSGTWSFTDEMANQILRDDNVSIIISEISSSSLILGLTWDKTTFGAGRLTSVSGNYIFSFK